MQVTKTQIEEWSKIIPSLDRLPVAPKRCVLHWTAGPGKANNIDRAHYHFIFNQPSGEVVPGIHSVASNMKKLSAKDQYAGHTGGLNSFSAGFSFAGMYNSAQGRKYGPAPLREEQVRTGLAFVALCMVEWDLPVNEDTLFTHYEAWTIHRVKGQRNDQKWDITELQFAPHLGKDEVGPWMRAVVSNHMKDIRQILDCGCSNCPH